MIDEAAGHELFNFWAQEIIVCDNRHTVQGGQQCNSAAGAYAAYADRAINRAGRCYWCYCERRVRNPTVFASIYIH